MNCQVCRLKDTQLIEWYAPRIDFIISPNTDKNTLLIKFNVAMPELLMVLIEGNIIKKYFMYNQVSRPNWGHAQ
jgi:hypothetical protein